MSQVRMEWKATEVGFPVYIAGSRQRRRFIQEMAGELKDAVPMISFPEPWWEVEIPEYDANTSPLEQLKTAHRQREAIKQSRFFILDRSEECNGALIEYGYALAKVGEGRCFVLTGGTHSQFDLLSQGQSPYSEDAINAVMRLAVLSTTPESAYALAGVDQ